MISTSGLPKDLAMLSQPVRYAAAKLGHADEIETPVRKSPVWIREIDWRAEIDVGYLNRPIRLDAIEVNASHIAVGIP